LIHIGDHTSHDNASRDRRQRNLHQTGANGRSLQTIDGRFTMSETDDQRVKMSAQRAEREIAALQQTIQRLEAEIGEARERAVKLAHYIELAREFGEEPPGETSRAGESTHRPNGAGGRVPKGGASGRAVQECISVLRERKQHIPTRELYEIIQQRGIQLGGASPIAALSGYLSRTPGVVADKLRRRGWGLEEWDA
jgi:hypothetical protein